MLTFTRLTWMFVLAAPVLLALPVRLFAQQAISPSVAKELESFGGTKSHIGACAISLPDGREILAFGADDRFAPASNMKVLTSAFALARLGGNFKFTTVVYVSGKDVLVKGDFDPTLGNPVMAADANKSIYAEMDLWAKALKDHLGDSAGNVVAITAGGAYRHADWPKDQYRRWYCTPIAELNFNDNCFDVRFDKSKEGGLVPVLSPQSRFINVVNSTRPGKGVYNMTVSADQSQVTLSGTAGYNMTDPVSNAFDNPPLVLARVLADRLELAGVSVRGKIIAAPADKAGLAQATPLIKTTTPLAMVMARANSAA